MQSRAESGTFYEKTKFSEPAELLPGYLKVNITGFAFCFWSLLWQF